MLGALSRRLLSRRQFLTVPFTLLLAPLARARGESRSRAAGYTVDVEILYGAISLGLTGLIEETVDRSGGRYQVAISGEGSGMANRIESRGILHGGRWAPLQTAAWFQVRGRESRSHAIYDYAAGTIEYHFRGETFFLRKVRVANDVVRIPGRIPVDDVISATLNYAEGWWMAQADGSLSTHVVRRRRRENEGPDDVEEHYQAELVPFVLRVRPNPETGSPAALFDMTRFSSWARESRPAEIVFGPERRPESISSSLILGTSVLIQIRGGR